MPTLLKAFKANIERVLLPRLAVMKEPGRTRDRTKWTTKIA
jgi:hypothetical protein